MEQEEAGNRTGEMLKNRLRWSFPSPSTCPADAKKTMDLTPTSNWFLGDPGEAVAQNLALLCRQVRHLLGRRVPRGCGPPVHQHPPDSVATPSLAVAGVEERQTMLQLRRPRPVRNNRAKKLVSRWTSRS